MHLQRPPVRINLIRAVIRSLPRGRHPMMNLLGRWIGTAGSFRGRIGPCRFVVDLKDLVAKEVYFTGCHEHGFSSLLHTALRPGGVFVDVGANFGYFTLLARAITGPKGACVAFEPDPLSLGRLRANLELNGFGDVRVVPKMCGDTTGTRVFHGMSSELDNWGMASALADVPGSVRMEVPCVRLDDELKAIGIDRVGVCKMDIEGGELGALMGFRDGIRLRKVDCFLVECHEAILKSSGQSVGPALALLRDNGYEIRKVVASRGAYSLRKFSGTLPLLEPGEPFDPWFHSVAFLTDRCGMPA